MALTEVPIELSSTPGIVDNSTSTAITIDASGNVDVTGTVTADGLTVDGTGAEVISVNSTANGSQINFSSATTSSDWSVGVANDATDDFLIYQALAGSGDIKLYTDGKTRVDVNNNGNISFYEDTGTTAKLFWDASAESLGIGTSSDLYAGLTILDTNYTTSSLAQTGLNLRGTASADGNYSAALTFTNEYRNGHSAIAGVAENADNDVMGLAFFTHSSTGGANPTVEAMRIDSSGNVGIGTASPAYNLDVYTTAAAFAAKIKNFNGTDAGGGLWIDTRWNTAGNRPLKITSNNEGTSLLEVTGTGLVGIGTSSPDQTLHVHKGSAGTVASQANSVLTLENSTTAVLQFLTPNTAANQIRFGDPQDNGVGYINYDHSTNVLSFGVNGPEKMRIDSSGNVQIGSSTYGSSLGQLRVISDATSAGAATPASLSLMGYGNINDDAEVGKLEFAMQQTGTGGQVHAKISMLASGTGENEGQLAFYTSDNTLTERMRLDEDGNLLVGTTDALPVTNNDANGIALRADGNAQFSRSGAATARFNRGTSDGEIVSFQKDGVAVGSIGVSGGPSLYMSAGDTGLQIYGAGSTDQIVPCDATGATRNDAIDLGKPTGRFRDLFLSGGMNLARDVSLETEIETYNNTNSGGAKYKISFRQNGTQVGVIEVGTSATNYVTSSDYRLKENVVAMSGATERLKQLAPKRFNFITTPDTTVDGFLAHEVQDIVPEAITGTKDAVDAEGNPEYQGIDQSKLVPLLVATIQELEARIAALEGAN